MKIQLMERYVKLILAGFDLHDGGVYVSVAFLNFLGMPGTVPSLISKAKKMKNGKWQARDFHGAIWVLLDSIPHQTRDKLNLNFAQDYLKDLLVTHKKCNYDTVLDQVKAESYLMLQKEISNYEKYLPNFYDMYQTKDERVTQAINLAILRVVVSFVQKYPKGLIEHFYDILKSEKIAAHSIPVDSKNYFYKYIKRIIRIGLPYALVNGNRDKTSNNLKLTPLLKELIIYLKAYGNYTSCREIEACIKDIRKNPEIAKDIELVSESTIRNYLATPEADNLTLIVRQGYRRFEQRILGYLPLHRTQFPLSKVLIDGYTIQVECEGEDQKPDRLVLFTIMDSYSGVVVGEVGETEDYKLIRRVFEKFLLFTRYRMPLEVVSDVHSSNQSKYFEGFRTYLEDNGVNWVPSPNPKRKAQLERWFGTLQQLYLTKIVGYVGEGIKSRRKDAHPSEEVKFLIKSRKYLKDKNEVVRLMLSAIDDYNRNAYFKDAASPLDLYHLKEPVHYIQLQDFHIPYFFWDKHEVTLNGSMVILKSTEEGEKKKWFYRSNDFDFSLQNGAEVDAYQNSNDPKITYVFKRGSVDFLKTLELQASANEAHFEQSEEDRRIIAEFGISKAKMKEAYLTRLDEIQSNLAAKFGIDPEELRRTAAFKKNADEYEGYKLGIAQKTPEPDISKPHKVREGRRAVKRSQKESQKPNPIHDTLG
jgi:hypothetical protein